METFMLNFIKIEDFIKIAKFCEKWKISLKKLLDKTFKKNKEKFYNISKFLEIFIKIMKIIKNLLKIMKNA